MLTLFRRGRLSFVGTRKDRAAKRSESRCAPPPPFSFSPFLHLSLTIEYIAGDAVGPVLFVLHNPLLWWNCSSYRIAFARCSVSDSNALSDLRSDWTDTTVRAAISVYLPRQNMRFNLLTDYKCFRLLMQEVLRIWNFLSSIIRYNKFFTLDIEYLAR